VLRSGARHLLAQAIEAEAEAFLAKMADQRLADDRARVVRHGHGSERTVQTGIGPVEVRRAKVRDRAPAESGERVRFTSQILPRWARRTRSLEALLPVLYLRGISTGDFQEALAALLGKDAPNLSPSVIARLKSDWQAECMLVVIGATPEGKKELVGFQVGTRESAQSWRELLVGLKARGLTIAPELVVGDGALGFWKALEEVFPATRHQRCWIHKAVNVLNKLPKSL
jgi:putative transposase